MGLNKLKMTSFRSLEMGPSLIFYPNNTWLRTRDLKQLSYVAGGCTEELIVGDLSRSKEDPPTRTVSISDSQMYLTSYGT